MLSTVFGWCKGKGPASATRVSGLSLRGLNLTCRNAAQISNKSLMPGGVMLYASPIVSSTSVLISVVAVLLSPLTFLLGWMAGMSTFAHSYEPFRRRHRPWSFAFLLPVILAMTVGLGLLGGKYWWLLSFGLAFLGHRKGTQRTWWSAVAYLAFLFREPAFAFRILRPWCRMTRMRSQKPLR